MQLIYYIFHIGIVFIIFHFIWRLFVFAVKQAYGPNNRKGALKLERMLKPVSMVLLTAVAAMKAHEFVKIATADWAIYVYAATGAFLVHAYLLERVRKLPEMHFSLKGGLEINLLVEPTLTDKVLHWVCPVLFIVFIAFPEWVTNAFTVGLSNYISDIYNIPVIGWVIALMGFFFLVRMVLAALNTFSHIFKQVSPQADKSKKSDNREEFTDYKIVEEDAPDSNPSGNQLPKR